MSYGRRLREALHRRAMSQALLATRTGISEQNVCHMLGDRRAPTLHTLQRVLGAVPDLDARWLITGEGDDKQSEA